MGGGHVTSNQKVLCTFQKIHSGVVWIFQQFLYTPKDALNHEFLSKILGNSASGTPLADSAELPPHTCNQVLTALLPSPGCQTTPPALWTGSLVLGLLFLGFLAHRLRKRCRPAQ